MQKLKANELTHISECILRTLTQNRITTVVEFLQEDVTKLTALTKLNLPQILETRREIFEKYSAPIRNGIALLDKKLKIIRTNIENLDGILEGGLPACSIIEICGLADSGKTQLCLQLAINTVINYKSTVLYVDTKGDFSAIRVQKILEASRLTHKEMAAIMCRIKVVRVWTLEEAIELLQSLKNNIIPMENLSLIIVDSLPCLMLQFLGDDNKIGLSMLNTLVNYSRYLCREMEISMIYVNIQTRWVDQDVADFDEDGDTTTMKDMYVEKRNRCLGKYWQHIPSLVLVLDKKQDNDENREKILLSVLKSNMLNVKYKQCTIQISELGVT